MLNFNPIEKFASMITGMNFHVIKESTSSAKTQMYQQAAMQSLQFITILCFSYGTFSVFIDNSSVIVGAAIFLSLNIFFLDRAAINSTRHRAEMFDGEQGQFWQKTSEAFSFLSKFAVRILLSVVFAMLLSTGLEIKLQEDQLKQILSQSTKKDNSKIEDQVDSESLRVNGLIEDETNFKKEQDSTINSLRVRLSSSQTRLKMLNKDLGNVLANKAKAEQDINWELNERPDKRNRGRGGDYFDAKARLKKSVVDSTKLKYEIPSLEGLVSSEKQQLEYALQARKSAVKTIQKLSEERIQITETLRSSSIYIVREDYSPMEYLSALIKLYDNDELGTAAIILAIVLKIALFSLELIVIIVHVFFSKSGEYEERLYAHDELRKIEVANNFEGQAMLLQRQREESIKRQRAVQQTSEQSVNDNGVLHVV